MTKTKIIDDLVAIAAEYAVQGYVSNTTYYLGLAKKYAGRKKDISNLVADVEQTCYETACRLNLSRARQFARRGNAPVRDYCLSLAEQYASKIGADISPRIAEVKAKDYRQR
ncbi:MAG: hypothetical protein AABW48_06455 [Nanoarchaeota archaeon]